MCTKRKYSTVDDAEYALAKVIISNWRGNMSGGIGGYYKCSDCGGYHITRQKHKGHMKLKDLYNHV